MHVHLRAHVRIMYAQSIRCCYSINQIAVYSKVSTSTYIRTVVLFTRRAFVAALYSVKLLYVHIHLIYTYIHLHTHVHMRYVQSIPCYHSFNEVAIRIYTHICIHTYLHTHSLTCIHTFVLYTHRAFFFSLLLFSDVFKSLYIYIYIECIHICIHTATCRHPQMYIQMYMYIYIF